EDALVFAIGPVSDAARRLRGGDAGIKLPFQFAGGGVEGDHFLAGRVRVEGGTNDDRIGLDVPLLAGVEGPGLTQSVNVGAIDLREAGVMIAAFAAIGRPTYVLCV